jgi:folate-dependent tRNA-U54 methylase TrmFO/GidA
MFNDKEVIVIGAGLAESEAAWQMANLGVRVNCMNASYNYEEV